MKKLIIKMLFSVSLLLTYPAFDSVANGNPYKPDNCGNCQGNQGRGKGNSVPIDGGAGLLLAAGAAYGLKKMKDYARNTKLKSSIQVDKH